MEVKILCTCGTKYKFDVDDAVRTLTDPITCPSCGVDGTAAANDYLAQAAPPPPMPPPVSVVPTVAKPAVFPSGGGKTIPLPGSHVPGPAAQKKRAFGEPNLLMGTVGAAVGGLIGMVVWYGLIVMLNWEFGMLAWGIGGLVGFGCRTLSGGYSPKLGLIAAACAVVAILGGEFFGTRSKVDGFFQKMTKNAYEEHMEYAKEAVTKTTEAEMRAFIAQHESDDDKTITPEAVTAAQISEFKKEQSELKDFINGKPNKEQFLKEINGHLRSADMQWVIFKNSFSLWTILWLFLGVGTAWRLGSGEVE